MKSFTITKKGILKESLKNVVLRHYTQPNDIEWKELEEKFSEEFVESLKDEAEIPRFERPGNFLLQIPLVINGQFRSFPFGFCFRNKKFITICEKNVEFLDELFLLELPDKTQIGLFIEMLFLVEEEYERFVKVLQKRIRQKKLNLSTLNNMDIIELVELEEALNNIITSAVPNVSVYEKALRALTLTSEQKEAFNDIVYNAKQNIEQARLTIKTVQNVRNAYSTIMQNNLNTVIKFLTSATIIIAIPTLIASLYGMNVALPFMNSENAFWYVLGTSIAVVIILSLFFKHKKWV